MNAIKVFNVCTALDKAFTVPANIMFLSLISNTTGSIHFHILVPESEFKMEDDFLKLSGIRKNIYFSFYPVKITEAAASISMKGTLHFSEASIYRIFMAELLPDSIDRILYLDADTLIDVDIRELFNAYSASILSARIENFETGYFNSGVLMTSLQYWRANNVTKKLISFLIENSGSIYKDQDALNSYFKSKNSPLHVNHNFVAMNYRKFKRRSSDRRIYHFTGTIKPWKSHAPQSYPFQLWRSYCALIFPDYNFRQPIKMSHLKHFINNLVAILKQIYYS